MSSFRQSRCTPFRVSLNLILLILASDAAATVLTSPATFVPSKPASTDVVRAEFTVSSPCFGIASTSTEVIGTVVRTTVASPGCVGLPPVLITQFAGFGPLSPGTYSYEIYLKYPDDSLEFRSSQELVVAPPIPILDTLSLLLLATVLAAIALTVLKNC